jgi:MFS transporter, putative metabolite:H+ symporter
VLPVLVGLWHITPGEIGWLFSAGYVGQLIGAVAFGWMAERYGRLKILQFSLALIAIFAGACAFAWSYSSFFWFVDPRPGSRRRSSGRRDLYERVH